VLTSVFGVPLSAFGTVLAQNRVGDPLALDLPVGLGRIVFLPSFVGQEAKEAGELLRVGLSALLSQPLPAAAPEWLEKYRLPGEEEIRKAAEELSREKERLNRKEQELQEAQKDLDTLKALLFPKSRMAFLPRGHRGFFPPGLFRETRASAHGILCREPRRKLLCARFLFPIFSGRP
jgi:hypothetical protein